MRASACSSVLQAPILAKASKSRFDASLLMVSFMFVLVVGCRLSSFEASCPSLDAFFVSIFPHHCKLFCQLVTLFSSHHHIGDANNMIDHTTPRTATPDARPLQLTPLSVAETITPPLGGAAGGGVEGSGGRKAAAVSSTRRRVLSVRNNEKNMIVMKRALERERTEKREGE